MKLILVAVIVALLAPAAARSQDAGIEFFEKKVRPILVERCYKCHSTTEKVKGGLLLDSKDALLKGGEGGAIIVAGDPDKSRLISAIKYANPELQMPPDKKLSDQQIADVVEWVKMGAPDPRGGNAQVPLQAQVAAPAVVVPLEERPWAFKPPVEPKLPQVKDQSWARTPIDLFILAKLEEKGLKAARPADKRTLIRRATFDLTGLPPTPEEIAAYEADTSPDAFAKVVERLLASPAYGERWGRHWLDVVRYTDSFDARGIGGEADVSEAWRYRDWVVKAFNQDLPYDQFVKYQVAGDILAQSEPGKPFNADGLVATGMYVIGEWGTGDADKEKMLTDIVDDQIDVTGRAFLGVTISCARCHDHKFDPISAADYYGIAGIFFSSHILPNPGARTAGSPVLRIPLVGQQEREMRERDQKRVAEVDKQLEGLLEVHYAKVAKELLPQTDKYLLAAFDYVNRPADQQAVTVEDFAGKQKLNAYALRQWISLSGAGPLKLLARKIDTVENNVALKGLRLPGEADTPNVVVNTSNAAVGFKTIQMPPSSLAVHPSPTTGVCVGWRSPITGTVRIAGMVTDADRVCGDGVEWGLGKRTVGGGTTPLMADRFDNGGSHQFDKLRPASDRLLSVPVEKGQMIQLTILPKGEYSCDTTVVELEITELGGEGRVWSLARDIVPEPFPKDGASANPRADRFGNSDVWHFYDAGDAATSAGFGADSIINSWFTASTAASSALRDGKPADRTKLESAAASVKRMLLALDAVMEQYRKAGKETKGVMGSNADLYRALTTSKGVFWAAARGDPGAFKAQADEQLAKLIDEQAGLKKRLAEPPPVAHGLQEGGTPESKYVGFNDARIQIRGRYDRLGDVVPRRFPGVLVTDEHKPITSGSGRVDLANWIASPKNPLTARVMANRIWQHHFGEGIVRTPNNYGKLGAPPTHPELLDWLALRFVEGGWSVKSLHRLIMSSAAYQQSSVGDPATVKGDAENLLVGRMNRRRLEAEALRDSLLSVAGRLDRATGGKAINDLNAPRRTMYLMTIRSERSNFRSLFDAADPTAIVEKRTESTVAPQALFLLNHPFVLEQTKALAQRALSQPGERDEDRIRWVYQALYGRPATEREVKIGLDVLETGKASAGVAGDARLSAWDQYCQVLVCANEFMYVD